MNFVRKIGAMMIAGVMAMSMMVGCATEKVPDDKPSVTTGSTLAANTLNDMQRYNTCDVKVTYVADLALETAMKKAIDDDMFQGNAAATLGALLGKDIVGEADLFSVKASDDGSIKEGEQVVIYVYDDSTAKGLTDEAWLKSLASSANAKYSALKEKMPGNQVVDVNGTYDVEWNFNHSGKAAMVKDIDEDGNVTRYLAVVLTCTTTATKTLAD